ncbi:unnamed protein product [Gongylonema pulchrum]|uniref:MMS1_N domain-containing protein n=1 Tax=Gongylonema pulchrum TaxID=637853 RepID=A0A183DFV5_9BILA|nr:unnamed protein product [Gongylonema pulchrum]
MQNVPGQPSDARLFIGTITGNIFGLSANTLEFSEVVLFEEKIIKRVDALDQGRSADQIAINPNNSGELLIAFRCRIIVHYSLRTNEVLRHWTVQQTITVRYNNNFSTLFVCFLCVFCSQNGRPYPLGIYLRARQSFWQGVC